MPASHDHDDEAFDAADDGGEVDVTPDEEAELTAQALDQLKEAGF